MSGTSAGGISLAPDDKPAEPTDTQMLDWLQKRTRCTVGDHMNPACVKLDFTRFWPGRLLEQPFTLREAIAAAMREHP